MCQTGLHHTCDCQCREWSQNSNKNSFAWIWGFICVHSGLKQKSEGYFQQRIVRIFKKCNDVHKCCRLAECYILHLSGVKLLGERYSLKKPLISQHKNQVPIFIQVNCEMPGWNLIPSSLETSTLTATPLICYKYWLSS